MYKALTTQLELMQYPQVLILEMMNRYALLYSGFTPFSEECVTENNFLISQTKTYVVDTQKNRLIETVLLSIQQFFWAPKTYA